MGNLSFAHTKVQLAIAAASFHIFGGSQWVAVCFFIWNNTELSQFAGFLCVQCTWCMIVPLLQFMLNKSSHCNISFDFLVEEREQLIP